LPVRPRSRTLTSDVGVNVGVYIAMAKRGSNSLDPLSVASLIKARKAGRHSDGGGLYLVVEDSGSARWAFLFRWRANRAVPGAGRLREMGLGSTMAVTLKRAREKAAAARAMVADGIDPIAARKAQAGIPTFGEMADEIVLIKTQASTSRATAARLKRLLEVHAEPLRPIRVDLVDTIGVLEILRPLWTTKPETAQKTRSLIEHTLSAAKVKGYLKGDNPAAWRGHLEHLLPPPTKLSRGHHSAMAIERLPSFVAELRSRDAISALALQFVILTASRVTEVLKATWAEIDLKERVWTVPAARMKSRREHRVPLVGRTIEILMKVGPEAPGRLVFPSAAASKPLTGAAFDRLMERMKVDGVTTHGFRSTFRDWVSDETEFPRELAEAALAHAVGDETERAYRRGDALEKRRELMSAWGAYLATAPPS